MQTSDVFEDREISWLKFNERVLEESAREEVPFCERLLFFHIFQTNLDEFFKVRVGTIIDRMEYLPELSKQLTDIKTKVDALNVRRTEIWRGLMAQARTENVEIRPVKEWTKDDRRVAAAVFRENFEPIISTSIIGKHRTSPFIHDRQTYLAVRLARKGGRDERMRLGLVSCYSPLMSSLIGLAEKTAFTTADMVVRANIKSMFADWTVKEVGMFRVTRSADLNPDTEYDDEQDYREFMARLMKRRRRLNAVRIEVEPGISKPLLNMLTALADIDERAVYKLECPFDFAFVSEIRDMLRNRPNLFYPKFSPAKNRVFERRRDIFEQIRESDRLLAYPYDSIQPFLTMLHDAAEDPAVIAIRMTLYRVAQHSQVVEELVAAAENGKEVQVLVELKARFDEENNIEWSRQLERSGCQVIYGLDGYKVHSKLCQIIRKEGRNLRQYTQIGTGNYNEKTSKLYTDYALFTVNGAIGRDVALVFRALALGKVPEAMKTLLVSPFGLRNQVSALMDGEIRRAKAGKPAYIGLKMNAITDKVLISKLYEASRAGVKIDLVVRGICSLEPEIAGMSENIRVVSIVGRFLEHSRVYVFGCGSSASVYIGSADFMTRNTIRRVEVAVPILSNSVKEEILEHFRIMLKDNCQAHELGADLTYRRRTPAEGEAMLNAQNELCRLCAKGKQV